MRRTNSSRSCWYERSSRMGTGSGIANHSRSNGELLQIERVDQIVLTTVAQVRVEDLNQDERRVVARLDDDGVDLYPRLARGQSALDLLLDERARGRRVRLHQEAAQAAAEGGSHDALARLRVEDDADGLAHLLWAVGVSERPCARVGPHGEIPSTSEPVQ